MKEQTLRFLLAFFVCVAACAAAIQIYTMTKSYSYAQENVAQYELLEIRLTAYSPSPHITDGTPFEMASGKIATVRSLQEMRYAALSRDLFKEFDVKYGDIIYIGFEVQDKMGPKAKNSADLFVRDLKRARWIGSQKRKMLIIRRAK